MRIVFGSFILFLIGFVTVSFYTRSEADEFNELSVNELLESLMDTVSVNRLDDRIQGYSAEIGADLVHNGFSKRDGQKKAKKQSKHFVCTSCHNVEREDADLANPDPEARLAYTSSRGLPFLQATTLYGAVNRSSFYNGDYVKKYGALIEPAKNDIRESIKLCAVECAQGRQLKDWEVESILAYMWDLELKMGDLQLSDMEKKLYLDAYTNLERNQNLGKGLANTYSKGGEIHFTLPPEDRKVGYALTGNPDNGALIYNNSCLHCHENQKYSYFNMDHTDFSLKYLARKADGFGPHSIYQVIRYGTFPKAWKKSYMPRYPKEKMSDQQVEDLRAYLEQKAAE